MILLKNKGFNPQVIYDIGAHKGDWAKETKNVFPNAQFFLFEANPRHQPELAATDFPYFLALLGQQEQITSFYSNGSTGDSIFPEQTKHYQGSNYETAQLQMRTLAGLVEKNNLPLPDFIKMDVQGAEKLIIEGSPEIIKHAEVIILEAKILEYNLGAPMAHEMISLMDDFGYRIQDLVEAHYLPTGELIDIDLLFIKKESNLIKRGTYVL